MVNTTVDNDPVSIQLNGSSTTVPSNETWVVRVAVHGTGNEGKLQINGFGATVANSSNTQAYPPDFKMVFTGGDTIAEANGFGGTLVTIQGFVVDS